MLFLDRRQQPGIYVLTLFILAAMLLLLQANFVAGLPLDTTTTTTTTTTTSLEGQGEKKLGKRDASFDQVPTKLEMDNSGRAGDPPEKYFHESWFHPHYDGRFAASELTYDEKLLTLKGLLESYLSVMGDIGAETWVMHGSLLGWWWNGHILPWDSDLDFQITQKTAHYLASYYNMSIHHHKSALIHEGRDYMLEINPNYVNRSRHDWLNVIDGRWVDTTTGLFIDITVLARNESHPIKNMYSCKDGHNYLGSSIFPLRDSVLEGLPVKIPYAYVGVLVEEYGRPALLWTWFEGHFWNKDLKKWEIAVDHRPTTPGPAAGFNHAVKHQALTNNKHEGYAHVEYTPSVDYTPPLHPVNPISSLEIAQNDARAHDGPPEGGHYITEESSKPAER